MIGVLSTVWILETKCVFDWGIIGLSSQVVYHRVYLLDLVFGSWKPNVFLIGVYFCLLLEGVEGPKTKKRTQFARFVGGDFCRGKIDG